MIRPALIFPALIFPALIGAALGSPTAAEPARVYSGEHGNFTRLVIELPSAVTWTLGRTEGGYAFTADGQPPAEFDLATVWQRIDRTRISALETDPASGALILALGCDCHVFPFEYQPGVVVLDIKPGPAPEGSAFEAAFVAPSPDAVPAPAGASGASYNWLADLPVSGSPRPAITLPLPLATGEVSLEPIRNALLEQLARGAADGVVDLGLTPPAVPKSETDAGLLPWSAIRIGEQPGILVSDPDAFVEAMLPAETCAADDLLDLASWGAGKPPLDLMSAARSDLFGEFDAPKPEAVLMSVRVHLYLGFGAEAAQQSNLLDATSAVGAEMDLYRSMARIVDGESDPNTPFANMLDCDGPAALWAALARDRLPAGPGVNRDAILRSFLALPPHLRSHLGSPLAERFLARDDVDAARMVRDAMERAPQADPAKVALLDAESNLHQGNAEAAQQHAVDAVALEGNDAAGLVALVEAHFRTLEPIPPDVAEALLALSGEVRGTEIAEAVARAIVLAQALSGDPEAAFGQEAARGETLADLWRVVLDRAEDDDFLSHAVLSAGGEPPDLAPDLDLGIATRLLDLGFPDSALTWLGPVDPGDPQDRRQVAAAAELGRGDARKAVDLLAGLSEPEAEALRAKALLQLGDLPAAKASLSAAGQADAAIRADLWRADWANLDPATPEAWQEAARLAQPPAADSTVGLLGRGAAAVEASTASRAALEALLTTVASPAGGG
jgi:hypothetical protein